MHEAISKKRAKGRGFPFGCGSNLYTKIRPHNERRTEGREERITMNSQDMLIIQHIIHREDANQLLSSLVEE